MSAGSFRSTEKSHRPLHQLDPSEALRDTLDAYQALIDEAVALADEAQQESTRLGALKLRLRCSTPGSGFSPALGCVPSELERRRMMEDAQSRRPPDAARPRPARRAGARPAGDR